MVTPLEADIPEATERGSVAIDVRSLRKRFGSVLAVDDITLTVATGEVVGFLGPNGAGKSTTMKILTGYLPATAGSASICGIDIARFPVEAKRRIGYLPEGAPLYGDMTPAAFLGFVAGVRGFDGREKKHRIATVVDRMGLAEVLYQRIETLSKGFRRRVGIAQAILHDPEVLVLDEPTDGLDPNQKHEVRSLVREMGKHKAIIVSTHILEEVDAVCDRAIIIDRGRVVGEGTPDSLHARARDHNAVTVRVSLADADALSDALRAVDGVGSVATRPLGQDQAVVSAIPIDGRFIADGVGAAIRASSVPVLEIRSEIGQLDEVFRTLTMNGFGGGRA
jgi:ABC-2 type transport system ATP-binding protein